MSPIPPHEPYDPSAVWDRVEARLNKMSDKEKIQTLINAGILTKGRQLAEPYRTGKLPKPSLPKKPVTKKVANKAAPKSTKKAGSK